MNAAHVRPMSAYLGLCAAAAFVVAQGFSVAPGAGPTGIARAGEPAMLVTESITLSVVESLTDFGAGVATAIVPEVNDASDSAVSASTSAGAAAAAATRTSTRTAPRTTARRSVALTPVSTATSHRSAAPSKRGAARAGSVKRADAGAGAARAPLSRRR